jgi:nicotinamide phosphoribosyltransferase
VWRDVYKDPVTDHGKRSKRGRLALVRDRGHWETVREEDRVGVDYLEPIFCNGEMLRDQTFADIRERSNTALD